MILPGVDQTDGAWRDYTKDPETWEEAGIDLSQMRSGKAICPKCEPTRRHKGKRDLSINMDKGAYHCWNDGCDFKGYLRGYNQIFTPGQPEYTRPRPAKTQRISTAGEEWLANRGISLSTAERYGVYTAKRTDIGDCIAFPYFDQFGELVHVKYRTITGKKAFRTTKDTERVFYGIDKINTSVHYLTIVEGEADTLAMAEAGIQNVISVPDGSSLKSQGDKLSCLESAKDLIEWAEHVVIATDGDDAGDAMAEELVRRIGKERCRRVSFPPGCTDANEVLMQRGDAAVRDLVRSAQFIPVDGIISILDYAEEIWENRDTIGLPQGWKVPTWPKLSEHYRMQPGQLTIILATPESGKSTWMRSYLTELARGNTEMFAGLFVPEDSPEREFWIKMLKLEAGQIQYMTEDRKPEYMQAVHLINDHFRIVSPPAYSLSGILELGRVMVYRHGMNAMLIDPWTEVRYDHLSAAGEYRQIELALSEVREFGKKYGVAMNVVVHPRKPSNSGDDDLNPYDARGTATWYDKADRFIVMTRNDKNAAEDVTTVKIKKTRNKAFGMNGEVRFMFDARMERFFEEPVLTAKGRSI